MQGFQGTFSELFEKSKECHEDPVTGIYHIGFDLVVSVYISW